MRVVWSEEGGGVAPVTHLPQKLSLAVGLAGGLVERHLELRDGRRVLGGRHGYCWTGEGWREGWGWKSEKKRREGGRGGVERKEGFRGVCM